MRVVRVAEVEFLTYGPNKLFDVTGRLRELAEGVREGFLAVTAQGSTGALVVLPPDAIEEFERRLWELVPVYGWRHPGNAYAHLRSTLIGTNIVIPVEGGELKLPRGAAVYFLENQATYNRRRKLVVSVVESSEG